MGESRRTKHDQRWYGSQKLGDPHVRSVDYFVLTGVFFHFWGYLDLYIEEQLPGKVGATWQEKLDSLPTLRELITTSDSELGMSSGLSIKSLRDNLAHNPMHIPHAHPGAIQFETGWRLCGASNDLKGPSTSKQRVTLRFPYYRTIVEKDILATVVKTISVIVAMNINSDIDLSLRVLANSGIDLLELATKYAFKPEQLKNISKILAVI